MCWSCVADWHHSLRSVIGIMPLVDTSCLQLFGGWGELVNVAAGGNVRPRCLKACHSCQAAT
jgi:hypothetical protein